MGPLRHVLYILYASRHPQTLERPLDRRRKKHVGFENHCERGYRSKFWNSLTCAFPDRRKTKIKINYRQSQPHEIQLGSPKWSPKVERSLGYIDGKGLIPARRIRSASVQHSPITVVRRHVPLLLTSWSLGRQPKKYGQRQRFSCLIRK